MPVWHKLTEKWRSENKLVILGVVQEQHPERTRLYAQWKQFDWPIVVDSLNLLGNTAVPQLVAIDEHGVVRSTRPNSSRFANDFVLRQFEAPKSADESKPLTLGPKVIHDDLIQKADHALLWQRHKAAGAAIAAYQQRIDTNKKTGSSDPSLPFRLGVAYRMRWDSELRQPDDFAQAVAAWDAALEANPNQYIWRRRIQQYGPKLAKPYPFYDWVEEAERQIRKRGEEPVARIVPLTGSERAGPIRRLQAANDAEKNPDPRGRILRDRDQLVTLRVITVPSRVRPGKPLRLHLDFKPSGSAKWNNEAEPLVVWLNLPEGWTAERRLLSGKLPAEPESVEARLLDVELRAPKGASINDQLKQLSGYALYYVCEPKQGQCLYLRQDFEIKQ